MKIRFENVSKSFGLKKPLDDLSFEISEGKKLFILGKSGTGKSVLLKHIIGLLRPDHGRVWVDDQVVADLDRVGLVKLRQKCGIVFQSPALFDFLDVEANIAFGMKPRGRSVDELLTLMDLPLSIKKQKPSELSFGMQKRVAIARTLATGADTLLFDEPTTGLDPKSRDAVNEWILHLHEKLGVTQVVVSHDMVSAKQLADHVIFLDQGRIAAQGSWHEIENSTHPVVRSFMIAGFK